MELEVGSIEEAGSIAFDIGTAEETRNTTEKKEGLSVSFQSTASFNDRQERLRTETLYNVKLQAVSNKLLDIVIKYGNNPDGVPPLLYAIKQNDLEAVKTLIEHGASLKTSCYSSSHHEYFTPSNVAEFAAAYGSSSLLAFLDSCRVSFETVHIQRGRHNYYLSSPIHVAAYYNNTTALQFIATKGVDIRTSFDPNRIFYGSPMQAAIDGDSTETFKTLINLGLDITGYINETQSILHYAGYKGAFQIVKLLLEKGLSPNLVINQTETVLSNSFYSPNSFEVVKVLLDHGAKISSYEWQQALSNSTPQIIELILKQDPSFAKSFKLEQILGGGLTEEDKISSLKVLLKYGAEIVAKSKPNPLHCPSIYYFPEIVRFVIQCGADVNARWDGGKTPLHMAIANSMPPKSVDILLQHGASITAKDTKLERTALHYACEGNAIYAKEIIYLLLNRGANVNAVDRLGSKPIPNGQLLDIQLLQAFVFKGANFSGYNQTDPIFFSWIHSIKNKDTWNYIFDVLKVDVNLQDKKNGQTAFMNRVQYGDLEMMEYLYSKGADINAKFIFEVRENGRNVSRTKTALSIAREHHQELVPWLLEHGAK